MDREQLVERLAGHGIVPWYPNSGRFDFQRGLTIHRRCLLAKPDPSIRPALRPICVDLGTTKAVGAATAGHLAESGLAPLYLLPHVHWEHERLDHQPALWQRVLTRVGCDPNDPALTGANPVVLQPGQTPLAGVITALLDGLDQSDVLLLTDAPLIIRLHHHQQVWFSTTDPALLPHSQSTLSPTGSK